jgi:hypothetical protein
LRPNRIFLHLKTNDYGKQNFIPNCPPPLWAIILLLMHSIESRAQEGSSCGCPDPAFNIKIADPAGSTLSDLQNIYSFFAGDFMTNNCLYIQGHLIVDKDFTIEGGEIIMGPGSEITLYGDKALSLKNVNQNGGMHGCTAMWKGISAPITSFLAHAAVTIVVENSIISDARHAIRGNRKTTVIAMGSQFRRNHIGILLPTLTHSGPLSSGSQNSLDLGGNYFWTDEQHLPQYTGYHYDPIPSILSNLAFGPVGIFVDNTTGVTIGDTSYVENVFEGLYHGIYGTRSGMRVFNARFINMNTGLNNTFGLIRHGITVKNGGTRPAVISHCNFVRCQVGFFSENTHVFVRDQNSFLECPAGVWVQGITGRDIFIDQNNTFNAGSSIRIQGVGLAKNISISDNVITAYPAFSGFSAGCMGISIQGLTGKIRAEESFSITKNIITTPPHQGPHGSGGIFLSMLEGATVSENEILLQEYGIGIIATLTEKGAFLYNKINVDATSSTNTQGIEIYDSPANKISCNEITVHSRCLAFRGVSDCIVESNGAEICTEIQGNKLTHTNQENLWLSTELLLFNAITSRQKWQGNQWFGVDINNPFDFGAYYIGDIAMAPLSKFIPHTNVLPYHPQHVLVNNSLQDPTVWFDPELGLVYYLCDPMAPELGGPDDVILIYETYAEGGFELAGYGKGAQWMADRHLYRNLKTAPALLSGTILSQFYSDAASGPIGAFYDIEQGIGTLGQIPDSVKTLLETLYEDEQTYTEAWDDVELLITNADSLQLPALEQQRQDIEDDLEAVASAIVQIWLDLEAARLSQIQALQTANTAITPANNPGHYLKSVNGIYLAHAADHSEWTTAERLTLDSITLLCPSEGGDAVYIARAMLGQLHGDDCMELPAAFQAPVPPVHTTLEEPLPGIYPNPGSNEFFLNVPVTQSGQAELRLYSLAGKQVHRVILPAETRSELNLSALPGGLYLYEVWGDGTRLMNGKLSKISQ